MGFSSTWRETVVPTGSLVSMKSISIRPNELSILGHIFYGPVGRIFVSNKPTPSLSLSIHVYYKFIYYL